MNEIVAMVDTVQKIGFVGILIVLAIPALRAKLGFNGNGKHDDEHEKIWGAIIEIRDNHLHEIKNEVDDVKTDVAWIRGRLDT